MKVKVISVAAIVIVAVSVTIAAFLLKDGFGGVGKELPDSSETVSFSSADSVDNVLGEKLQRCAEIVQSGTYSLTVTQNRQIGGLSLPITTYTYYGDGFISIKEYEGHDIVTEIFINAEGAYYLNSDLNEAFLLPASTAEPDTLELTGLKYVESGSTVAGTSAYEYERYINSNGETVDYLFAGESLEKIKLYGDDGYELITVKLSTDTSSARSELPQDITVIDRR